MFGKTGSRNNSLVANTPQGSENEISSTICNKSSEFHSNSAKAHRESIKKSMRMAYTVQTLPYEGLNSRKFGHIVEEENNVYSLLRTIFAITDESGWRHYIAHLQILIKKFTNSIASSNGRILEELSQPNSSNIFDGYSLQQRIESMLHLSDKVFQEHLLIFVHGLIAYNRRYGLLDQASLSLHLLHRHNYQQHPASENFWLLSRMTVNPEAVNKIFRNYYSFPQEIPLLSILMIVSNYTYEQTPPIIQLLIQTSEFQEMLNQGLNSSHYQTQRETVLIYNNLLFKSVRCRQFVLDQVEIQEKIQNLKNEESAIFGALLKEIVLSSQGEIAFGNQNF